MKANVAMEYWHDDLAADYRDPLELIETTDLKIVAQSLRYGLGKYLFEDNAYLKEIDSLAWQGLQRRWPSIRGTIAKFLRMLGNYSNWLTELRDRDSQLTDPIGLRSMVHQKSADTEVIIAGYAELVSNLKPVIEEALQFL